MTEICRHFGAHVSLAGAIRYYNKIVSLCGIVARKRESHPKSTNFKVPRGTGTLVVRWCESLGIHDSDVKYRCQEVVEILLETHRDSKPVAVAASAIFLVTQGFGVTLEAVSRVSSVSPRTITSILSLC
eukprot:c2472_g1_i2.p1 GENE.c2472_g1_i2~~c2472_g1_i2.p1  ORF type:complete len:129 (+),score=1.23 c2472_g1_i2:510-896(+)